MIDPRQSGCTFMLVGAVSLLIALILFFLFAMSGGSGDCAVSQQECRTISGSFGFGALVFAVLTLLSFWKAMRTRSTKRVLPKPDEPE